MPQLQGARGRSGVSGADTIATRSERESYMALERNSIPDKVKRIHLIAVCGTGMGALACMLKDLGYEVTGSDQRAYPPMSRFLENKGIVVSDGFHEDNLLYGPDLVIVGNAVIRDNPEAKKMNAMGLNFCSMPQAINHFIVAEKKTADRHRCKADLRWPDGSRQNSLIVKSLPVACRQVT